MFPSKGRPGKSKKLKLKQQFKNCKCAKLKHRKIEKSNFKITHKDDLTKLDGLIK